jgi:hypothetical protein
MKTTNNHNTIVMFKKKGQSVMKIKNKNKMRILSQLVFIALFLLLAGQGAMGQSVGDYKSAGNGNWNSLSTWVRWDGDSWETPTSGQGWPGQNTGTGAVTIQGGNDVLLNTNVSNSFTSLTITGVSTTNRSSLYFTGNADYTLSTLQIYVVSNGEIYFGTGNPSLELPANASILVFDGGRLWDDGTGGGTCSGSQRISVGGSTWATCGGGAGEFTFASLNASGGSVTAIMTNNGPKCAGSQFYLGISYTGAVGVTTSGGSTQGISYVLKEGATTIQSGTLTPSADTNTFFITKNTAGSYTYSYTVTTYVNTTAYTQTETQTVVVNDKPGISTVATPAALCNGASYNPATPTITANGLIVTSQGWEIETTAGGGTYTNLSLPLTVSTSDNGKKVRYYATNSCGTSYSNLVTLTVNPLPQGSIAGNTICVGSNGQFTFTASSGTGPYTLVISGVTYSGKVSGTPFNVNTNPGSTTTYTLTSVTDANGCQRTTGFTNASATITVATAGVWTGTVSTDWYNTGNWCGFPNSSTDVVIQSTATFQPHITNTSTGAVCRNISIGPGASLTFDGAYALDVYGNWTNSGTFTAGTGTVNLVGGTAQSITGATSFYNLTLNNANNLTLNNNATVTNTLTFTTGNVVTGSNILTVGSTGNSGTITGTSGWINGTLRRYIPGTSGPTVIFTVGDAGNSAPVSVQFAGTPSGSGYLDVSTAAIGAAPPVASGISQTKYVNRKWTITNGGVAGFTSYSPTLNFVSGDLVGTPTPSTFIVSRYDGSYNTTVAGTRTATSTQATGITDPDFGIFYVGESGRTCVIINQGAYTRPLQ